MDRLMNGNGSFVEPVRIAVVGLGYWGPNLARNLGSLPGCELAWLCDGDPAALQRAAARFPGARATAEVEELLADPALDAIVVATPVPTHADLAVRVLEAGKHCFVEKPLAQSVPDAQAAVDAAAQAGRVLMVGHLLEYHPGVAKLKEIAESGELGDIHYIYSNRLNLGKLRADENGALARDDCAGQARSNHQEAHVAFLSRLTRSLWRWARGVARR
jgi:predicted dehydrogenase